MLSKMSARRWPLWDLFFFPPPSVYFLKHFQTKSAWFCRKSLPPLRRETRFSLLCIPLETMTNLTRAVPTLWLSPCLLQPSEVFYYLPLFLASSNPKKMFRRNKTKMFPGIWKHQRLRAFWLVTSSEVLLFVVAQLLSIELNQGMGARVEKKRNGKIW